MNRYFESCAGSITGTDHKKPLLWRNNQDAFRVVEKENVLIAVVADGCGSGKFNEMGAHIGINLITGFLVREFVYGMAYNFVGDPQSLAASLEGVRIGASAHLAHLIRLVEPESRSQFVNDHLLFTLQVLVITDTTAFIAGIGDGVYAVNGEVKQVGPFEKNEPPYLAYGDLVKSSIAPESCKFVVHACIPADELASACIGTDGAADFTKIATMTLPGKSEVIGPLSNFWTQDAYFKNPQALQRRLNLINNPSSRIDWERKCLDVEHGRLKDDTTLVVVRRRLQPKE